MPMSSAFPSKTQRAVRLSALALLVIFGLSFWLAWLLQREAAARHASELREMGRDLQGRTQQFVLRRVEALRAVQAYFLSAEGVTPGRFSLFVRTAAHGLSGLEAMLYFDADLHVVGRPLAPGPYAHYVLTENQQATSARRAVRQGQRVVCDPTRLPDGSLGFWAFAPLVAHGRSVGVVGSANALAPLLAIYDAIARNDDRLVQLSDSHGRVFYGEAHMPANAIRMDLVVDDRIWHLELASKPDWDDYLPIMFAVLCGLSLCALALGLIWTDLFSSKRLEREVAARTADLQASRDQLRAILDGVDDGIVAIGADGDVVYANQAARAQLTSPDGRRNGLTRAGRFADFVLRDREGRALAPEERPSARALRGETLRGEVLTLEVPGAEPLQMLFKATPIRVAGEIPLAIVISQNVTERLKLENALREQLKAREAIDRMKSDFLSVVTHELRTPLTSIKGYTEFLEDGIAGDLTPEQLSYVHQVQTATQQLEALVDDLLDMARMEAGEFTLRRQTVDVTTLASQALEAFQPQATAHGVHLTLDCTRPLEMTADPVRLTQILNNLLSNALKFTPDGGEVALKVLDRGPEVEFEVCDTGIGIAPENIPRLFSKFYQVEAAHTRAHKGTGLGLAITKGLVEMHGGRVAVESQLGAGTRFFVFLPKTGQTAA